MKAYLVYQGVQWKGDLHAMLVREDGHVMAEHVCSNESFIPGDLWVNRPERKKARPDLDVDLKPRHIEEFKKDFREVFDRAFEERVIPKNETIS